MIKINFHLLSSNFDIKDDDGNIVKSFIYQSLMVVG